MARKKLAFILGIRPDVIRACLMLERLREADNCDLVFIWSGQHYFDNLKDVFFRELNVVPPEIELGVRGETDAEISSGVIAKLYPVLEELRPEAAIFLGDTNTVMGSMAAAQLNIPVVHIEGCMRSYDWRMPEEKYRTVIDHVADVIYAYYDEYKQQGVDEGLNPRNIVVVGNPIVDVLNRYYFDRADHFEAMSQDYFGGRGIEPDDFYLMTCHRRENVENTESLRVILSLMAEAERPIYFPAGYRTQKILKRDSLQLPDHVTMVDPVGYEEFLLLMTRARGVITDSGTVVEETCVLGVPSLQVRKSTERPQVYDVGSSVKFDPARPGDYSISETYAKLEALRGRSWPNPLGDGKSSARIADDLLQRVEDNNLHGHRPENYHLRIDRSYREDGLD